MAAVPSWTGQPVIDTEAGPARIVPCVSSLAVREALAGREDEDETLVILTDRDEADLGEEVLARVWRQRLLRPSGWDALKHQFRVDNLDPALADHRWLVDLLVDVAPARRYPAPPSGFLDLPTAWRTLLRHALRLDTDRPRADDLVRWGQTEWARTALAGPARAHADRIAERLAADAGPLAGHVLRLVAEGRGSELVPFGLVCDVLWASGAAGEAGVVAARARFETPLGARNLAETIARDWAHAASELVRRATEAGDDPAVSGWLARAEHLLAEFGALGFAASSDVLPAAFGQRLESAGRRLSAFLDRPGAERLAGLEEAAVSVQRHLRAGKEPERARILQMAVRLARRLTDPPTTPPADLAQATAAFAEDGAWVDAARDALAEGETVQPLGAAYGRLAALVDGERHQRDRAFAAAFAGWSTVAPTASRP
ncbi:MAG: BREX-2 system phosphatase PglZ, partial [Micromonosporaceae bacterium]|nr:BREX-2 system phosphatase PglZ [Micromonosporaceae bacterium]